MQIGIIGLPNKGKSTLLNAMSSADAQVANYPFTTIQPNQGIGFASKECPHVRLNKKCHPNNAPCENGWRQIPVNVLDVAGLVENAHEGKGMGNQFLADVAPADALVIVADASGSTDSEGHPCPEGRHDPVQDVEIVLKEVDYWLADVLKRNAKKVKGKPVNEFEGLLSGIKITGNHVKQAYKETELPEDGFAGHTDEEYLQLARALRKAGKPLVIAANKIDLPSAKANVAKLKTAFPEWTVIPVAADAELALKKAREKGWVEYDGKQLQIKQEGLDPRIVNALETFRKLIKEWGSTGVQRVVNECTFRLLNQMVVYPVEDEVHYANHFGKVLPDAILLDQGTTPTQLAEKIHTDLAKGLLYAVDAEKRMRIGKDSALHDGQIVKIVSAKGGK
ncbi:YchF-related putative GTPase [Candidatus Micrarchaeota archaeon]|nr:YchF-related putative GTPase [Candidatus Micrarchaeota archaeon]